MNNYNPDIHHRRSIRLKEYDYSREGYYFITTCVQNHKPLFGDIIDDEIVLNDAGKMVEEWYYELENKFTDLICGEMVVMPNHMHFIIQNTGENVGANLCVCPEENVGADLRVCPEENVGADLRVCPGEHVGSPLPCVIQWFKTMTTNKYIQGVKTKNWHRFNGRLWQRNYWEHIIRFEKEYNQIAQYIADNPAKWKEDKLNLINEKNCRGGPMCPPG